MTFTQKTRKFFILGLFSLAVTCLFAQEKDTTIYPLAAVEAKPLYEGKADSAIYRAIGRNLRMPMSVRYEVGTVGRVYINFVVDEQGTLEPNSVRLLMFEPAPTAKNPKPKRVIDEKLLTAVQIDCVVESKRVIGLLTNWTPAKIGGKGVRCTMTLPISFKNEGTIIQR
ncbi:MAG: hypothetical protein JNL70_18510 [Saprospiraceae bacterium]|nr:hypothetical protein [Saprospiraceae bacterium]